MTKWLGLRATAKLWDIWGVLLWERGDSFMCEGTAAQRNGEIWTRRWGMRINGGEGDILTAQLQLRWWVRSDLGALSSLRFRDSLWSVLCWKAYKNVNPCHSNSWWDVSCWSGNYWVSWSTTSWDVLGSFKHAFEKSHHKATQLVASPWRPWIYM